MIVLGLDPGTRKCGYAVVDSGLRVPLALGVIPIDAFDATLREVAARWQPALAAIGAGTAASRVTAAVAALGIDYRLVDERETSLQARARFFQDHPPRGWRRLVPQGMLLPDRPIDDYAALLIAERFLRSPE